MEKYVFAYDIEYDLCTRRRFLEIRIKSVLCKNFFKKEDNYIKIVF
jgi:hypothetical protein